MNIHQIPGRKPYARKQQDQDILIYDGHGDNPHGRNFAEKKIEEFFSRSLQFCYNAVDILGKIISNGKVQFFQNYFIIIGIK